MAQIKKIGPLKDIMSMMPGYGNSAELAKMDIDDRELFKVEAIINSMTPKERKNHDIINGSRRKRIAQGSGTTVQDVNHLLKTFSNILTSIKRINKGKIPGFFGKKKSFLKDMLW